MEQCIAKKIDVKIFKMRYICAKGNFCQDGKIITNLSKDLPQIKIFDDPFVIGIDKDPSDKNLFLITKYSVDTLETSWQKPLPLFFTKFYFIHHPYLVVVGNGNMVMAGGPFMILFSTEGDFVRKIDVPDHQSIRVMSYGNNHFLSIIGSNYLYVHQRWHDDS